MAVVQSHLAAIPGAHRLGPGYVAIGRGAHRRAIGRVDVDARLKGAFPVERILRSPKLDPTRPSTGQIEGASANSVQSPAKLGDRPPSSARETRPASACARNE